MPLNNLFFPALTEISEFCSLQPFKNLKQVGGPLGMTLVGGSVFADAARGLNGRGLR